MAFFDATPFCQLAVSSADILCKLGNEVIIDIFHDSKGNI